MVIYNPHDNHQENTHRIYTKGNRKEIKTCHYKKQTNKNKKQKNPQLNTKEGSNRGYEGKKAIRHTEN